MTCRLPRRLLAAALLAVATMGAAAAEEARLERLKIGLLPGESSLTVMRLNEPLRRHLETRLGLPVELQVGTNYAATGEALRFGRLDIAYLGPVTYVLQRERAEIVPFATPRHAKVGAFFEAAIIVPADSRAATLKDLAGAEVAFGDPASTSARGCRATSCWPPGCAPVATTWRTISARMTPWLLRSPTGRRLRAASACRSTSGCWPTEDRSREGARADDVAPGPGISLTFRASSTRRCGKRSPTHSSRSTIRPCSASSTPSASARRRTPTWTGARLGRRAARAGNPVSNPPAPSIRSSRWSWPSAAGATGLRMLLGLAIAPCSRLARGVGRARVAPLMRTPGAPFFSSFSTRRRRTRARAGVAQNRCSKR